MKRVKAWLVTAVVAAGLPAGCFGVTAAEPGDAVDASSADASVNAPPIGIDASFSEASSRDTNDVARDAGHDDTSPMDATRPDATRVDASEAGLSDAGCSVGSLECNGLQPEVCAASGTWANVGAPCSGSTPACLAGACVPCAPDTPRCSGAGLDSGVGLETCTPAGGWGIAVACSQPTPACGQSAGVAACCSTLCSGACVDEQADSNNCGGCGTSCPVGQTCQSGSCACTTSWCGGVCVDEQTDNANCGGCGLVCSTRCTAGRCLVTLASGQGSPTAIVVDTTSVYWTDNATAFVMKVPVVGGALTTLVSGVASPSCIAVDATSVYFGTDGPGLGHVMKVPLGGGTPTTLASPPNPGFPIDGEPIGAIAADATSVYWTTSTITAGGNPGLPNAVLSVPLGGGTVTTLAWAWDWTDSSPRVAPGGLAVDATNLYWGVWDVFSEPVSGGTYTTLVSPQEGDLAATSVAVDNTNIYWAASGSLMAMPLIGGAPITLASGQSGVVAFAIDATNVYWTTQGGASLTKAPLGGGAPTALVAAPANSQYRPQGITVDATSVYWTDAPDGTVLKLTPK